MLRLNNYGHVHTHIPLHYHSDSYGLVSMPRGVCIRLVLSLI